MAAYKNQHFVPRVHLKPFSDRGEGKAISLYTAKSNRYVYGAPVSSQCSKDYFYGRDGVLELQLNKLESQYGARVREIVGAGRNRPNVSTEWMRLFWCAQWARTEAAAETAKSMAAGAAELIDHPPLAKGPDEDRWVLVTMSALKRAHETTRDLTYLILRNRTNLPFVTSDNPAIMFNKFHVIDRRVRHAPFGLGSAGAVLLLPLTPCHAIAFYDADVYTVQHKNAWFDIDQPRDVEALNQHQILNCLCNVYFSSGHANHWIEPAFNDLATERSKPLWVHQFAVLDGVQGGMERYKVIQGLRPEQRNGLLIAKSVPRVPNLWPSFLNWRHRGLAFDTGTGAGVVRRTYIDSNPLARFRAIRISK